MDVLHRGVTTCAYLCQLCWRLESLRIFFSKFPVELEDSPIAARYPQLSNNFEVVRLFPQVHFKPYSLSMFSRTVILKSGLQAEQAEIDGYLIDFHRGNADLVVTFESADHTIDRANPLRDGWSVSFLARRGYSVLCVKAASADWYRNAALHRWFRKLRPFLAHFDRTIFTGSSMGGYAALVFSQVAPNSVVIAHNPQSTVDHKFVPWEHRYPLGWVQDWSGDFSDAAGVTHLARQIYVTYDPFEVNDRRHVDRLRQDNITHLKMPLLGHGTPFWLQQLGLLAETTEKMLDESLTSLAFAKLIRVRRSIPRYHLMRAGQLMKSGRYQLANQAALTALDMAPGAPEAKEMIAKIERSWNDRGEREGR